MANQTDGGIGWTDETWNPIRGCRRKSAGCKFCYAEQQAGRMAGPGQAYEGLVTKTESGWRWTGLIRTVPTLLDKPLRWKQPRMIFVNSMSDLHYEDLEISAIDEIYAVMYLANWHIFQTLTKRAEEMYAYLSDPQTPRRIFAAAVAIAKSRKMITNEKQLKPFTWPLPNVWVGTSVEDDENANRRIAFLLASPAAIHYLSAEPLLAPMNLLAIKNVPALTANTDPLYNAADGYSFHPDLPALATFGPKLDWVIAGAESGDNARPMNEDWVRSLRDQCISGKVAFFYKQNAIDGKKIKEPELDGKRWMEFPKTLESATV